MPLASFKPESMFHRRLLMLAGLVALGMVAPVLQLGRWTVGRGTELREQAEGYLSTWRWLPTTRGKILDRKGRVLAADRPSFDVAVDYRVITGQWAYEQAYKRARRLHREEFGKLSRAGRREIAERYEPEFRTKLDLMWDQFAMIGGIPRDELEARKEEVKETVQKLAARIDEPIVEEQSPHVLLRQVDDRVAFEFLRRTADARLDADDAAVPMPGVSVIDTGTREYPLETIDVMIDRSSFPPSLRSDRPAHVRVEGVATHVLGWMRHRVYREDNWDQDGLTRPLMLPDGTPDPSIYLDGESIGQTGMERGAESELRGRRGIQTTKLDTRETVEAPAQPGKDITLTIDAQLQARIQALLAPAVGLTTVQPWHISADIEEDPPRGVPRLGEPLAGSSVVIDVASGEILALVSSPSFTRAMLKDEPEAVFRDQLMMTSVNRAISQPYACGSIVKPLILCAAVTEGRYSPDERIACTGSFYPNQPDRLRCWTQKLYQTTHTIKFKRDPDGRDAINGSCNIFFYELGRRLGGQKLNDWFQKFGIGRGSVRWSLGLSDEYAGTLPSGASMTTDAAILMGIGQGPIAWTPVHAADAFATLARAGVRILPKLRKDAPTRTIDLHLNPSGVEQALAGLADAVRDANGTAHHITYLDPHTLQKSRESIFNAMDEPGISVWAKSGTADASALVARDSEGNRELIRDGDHSWCVFLVGDDGLEGRPKYAVSVVVDYGGSGGRVAGPIANQVVRALIAEGYLHPKPRTKDDARAAAP